MLATCILSTDESRVSVAPQAHLHQKTGLPAGTVTDDDEFAANFSHLGYTTKIVSEVSSAQRRMLSV